MLQGLQLRCVLNCLLFSDVLNVNNKHLMTGPKGNTEFCFPKTLNASQGKAKWKQNSLFPAEPVIKCFVIPTNSKLEKNGKEIVCFTPAG